jgi:NAD+ synthase
MEVERIVEVLQSAVLRRFRKKGVVIGVSGGVDSTTSVALCARALGPQRVLAIQMPERTCDPETMRLSALAADHYCVPRVLEDITPALEAVGFFRRYEAGVRKVIPEYGEGWKSKLVIPGIIDRSRLTVFSIVAQRPDGELVKKRLSLQAYLEVVAATNFKQRLRKMMEYYHADRLNYAVIGTPNRLEYDQGFFVKGGDGAADIKPIAHLYKSQVYRLAEYLDVPEEIRRRPPTTDTYSLQQGQDEFYFSLPYDKMDLCLLGKNHGHSHAETARSAGLSEEEVVRVYADIEAKRNVARYLHASPVLVE